MFQLCSASKTPVADKASRFLTFLKKLRNSSMSVPERLHWHCPSLLRTFAFASLHNHFLIRCILLFLMLRKVVWGSERDVTNAFLMYPRLWEVGVYSQPPHERWGLELRTSLFLSELTKLVTLGAHKDKRHFLRNETNRGLTARVRARFWLVVCADACWICGVFTLWLQNIP